MKRLGPAVAAAAALAIAANPATGQTLFNGAGCGGDKFEFCASWTGTYVDATHLQFFVTNTSGVSAGNPLSAFTTVGLGNVAVADPASMGAVTGWQYDPNLNGFAGFGLLENQFGAITFNGVNNALTAGASLTFSYVFGSSIGTYAQAQTAFAGVQIAIIDQGPPAGITCATSTAVLYLNSSTTPSCAAVSTVPEPGTAALAATGLIGLLGFARRRRYGA